MGKLPNTLKPGIELYARCPICGYDAADHDDLTNHVSVFHWDASDSYQYRKLILMVAEQQRAIDALTARLAKLEGKAE